MRAAAWYSSIDLDAVLEHRRDLVALSEAETEERARDLAHPPVELREREPLVLEHESRVVGPVAGVSGEQRVERHQLPPEDAAACPQRTTVAAHV